MHVARTWTQAPEPALTDWPRRGVPGRFMWHRSVTRWQLLAAYPRMIRSNERRAMGALLIPLVSSPSSRRPTAVVCPRRGATTAVVRQVCISNSTHRLLLRILHKMTLFRSKSKCEARNRIAQKSASLVCQCMHYTNRSIRHTLNHICLFQQLICCLSPP